MRSRLVRRCGLTPAKDIVWTHELLQQFSLKKEQGVPHFKVKALEGVQHASYNPFPCRLREGRYLDSFGVTEGSVLVADEFPVAGPAGSFQKPIALGVGVIAGTWST
jgi:hypothetical protein